MAARIKKQKIVRVKLDNVEMFDEYFEDMNCIACISTMQPYQFAHELNILLDKNFRMEMQRIDNDETGSFIVYKDTDIIRNIEYSIICNRNRTEFLIPELRNADFLILMNGMNSHSTLFNSTMELLNSHNKITYTFDFDPIPFKSKEYLVL